MEELTLEKFEEASDLVREVTTETKLVYSEYFSSQTGNKVYFKPENMQYTGAYKVRGAYYKISTLSGDEKAKGLITASAGNHAQGVAYAAKLAGVKATVVMPTTTPLMKVNRTKSYGADVVLEGDVFDEACDHAYKLAEEFGYTFVHPFDDLDVATGQGTIAMEIIKELPTVDYILVPIGGGGLCTGVSTLAKLLNPKIKVIGVEPAGANCMQVSLKEGKVVGLPQVNTIADGTAVKRPGEKLFPYIQENVDSIITIEDIVEEIVGEIEDEFDPDNKYLTRLSRREWLVDGRFSCDDAIELGWPLEESDDYETIAGWILELCDSVPDIGEVFEVAGYKFKVQSMRGQRISLIRVIAPAETDKKDSESAADEPAAPGADAAIPHDGDE